ncbi:LITAF-like zinc ribbon domain-containing protein [Truncatella angustata]|uniref:LITAF-like zinc ribbon domain-containing protein n=1 Tax=Truncatella angustata TaxID=152316 RepID=A0A9P8ZXD4_9PEZI|nr:LITAF-like zinc ribbon domain-containing protein [Truncatella angustata]KAH6654003.1 LITAF-like zinc ribbon domain-containing protein [Truncatella angustata]KAH8197511.1 hypothetical protein TruAng_008332 [Truncatella angustata]
MAPKFDYDTMSTTRLPDIHSPTPPYAVGMVDRELEHSSRSEHRHQAYVGRDCQHTPGYGPSSNLVPLPLLARYPALAECPGCRSVGPTSVHHRAGKGTHWMATFFFFTTGILALLPYTMDHFKNAEHTCMKCGRKLATQRFGGGTKAHLI